MEMMEERDEQMRLKYYDPIENFPDKIDQLLAALNRVRLIENHQIFLIIFRKLRRWISMN